MISLKDNRTALYNLSGTIEAIGKLDYLIEFYGEDKPGPAYATFSYVKHVENTVQFDRKIIVDALKAQRKTLVDYMATLGIDAEK